MQVISKIEQPINVKSSKDLMQIITKILLQGQESAQLIRSLFTKLKVEDHQADFIHHSLVALNSFKDAISIAKSFDFDHQDVIKKRKFVDHTNNIQSSDQNPVSGRGTISKERRGCYKRRRTGETRTQEVTDLIDDGHAWRKYGQKEILNTKFPRNYYRCTHKHDQDCQATKQVQQISENPTKYNIIYNGNHTCKNLQKSSSIIINPEEKSSFFLSFETNNYPTLKNELINSSNLFPPSVFLNNPSMVKQEYNSIKEELPISQSEPHDLDHQINHQYSSSSENLPSSSDLTSSTPVSDQGDSYDYGDYYDDDLFNLIDIDDTQFHLDDIMKFSTY